MAKLDFCPQPESPPVGIASLIITSGAAAIVAAVIVILLTPYGSAVSPDSVSYLDIATHIRHGDGWGSSDLRLAYYGENRVLPNAAWPPMYPLLLALWGEPSPQSAVGLSWLALTFSLVLIQFLLRPLLGKWCALICALPFALAVPMLTIHAYVWSEQWFVVFSVGMMLSLQIYLINCEETAAKKVSVFTSKLAMVSATCFAVAAFYTRYVGIAFFPVPLIAYFIRNHPASHRKTVTVSYLFYGVSVLALLIYNRHVSGDSSGTFRAFSTISIMVHVHNALSAFLAFFYSAERKLIALACALVASFLLIALGRYRVNSSPNYLKKLPVDTLHASKMTLILAFLMSGSYVVTLVLMRTIFQFDDIDIRLLSGVSPFLWVGTLSVWGCLGGRSKMQYFRVFPAFVASILVFNGYMSLLDARHSLGVRGEHFFKMGINGFVYRNYNPAPEFNAARKFYLSLVGRDSVLVIGKAGIYKMLTGLNCLERNRDLSDVEIRKLGLMPQNSLMTIEPDELESLEAKLNSLSAEYNIVQFEGQIFLQLPIGIRSIVAQ